MHLILTHATDQHRAGQVLFYTALGQISDDTEESMADFRIFFTFDVVQYPDRWWGLFGPASQGFNLLRGVLSFRF